jgi:hypothetical protein
MTGFNNLKDAVGAALTKRTKLAGEQELQEWARGRIENEGFSWIETLVADAVHDGVFAGSGRQKVPKTGKGGGAGTRVIYGPRIADDLLYLFEGVREGLSVKETARGRRAGLERYLLGLLNEERANRFQAMRPALILLNHDKLPGDTFSSLWWTPKQRGKELPRGFVKAVRDSMTFDLFYKEKRYRDHFPMGMVFDPPTDKAAFLVGIVQSAEYEKWHVAFLRYVDMILDARTQQARRRVRLPRGAGIHVVNGYRIEEYGGIQYPRAMSLLEHAWTHLRALVRAGRVDDYLHRCVNSRCRSPYFYPWKRSGQDFCENPSCRSQVGHYPSLRRAPSRLDP